MTTRPAVRLPHTLAGLLDALAEYGAYRRAELARATPTQACRGLAAEADLANAESSPPRGGEGERYESEA